MLSDVNSVPDVVHLYLDEKSLLMHALCRMLHHQYLALHIIIAAVVGLPRHCSLAHHLQNHVPYA